MGNKSFSLAVLPLHRFISILIFMYLEKCSVFFLFLFFSWKNTGTRKTISLDFTTVMSFDLLCKRNNNKDGFYCKVGWLCWGLTSQSTIFQSYRDGAIASWVINQYFRGVKCLAQGHNTAAVGLEPRTSRSGVRHSTTEPPRSPSTVRF